MSISTKAKILIAHPFGVMTDIIRFMIESEFNISCKPYYSLSEVFDVIKDESFDIIIVATTLLEDTTVLSFSKLKQGDPTLNIVFVEHQQMKTPKTHLSFTQHPLIHEDHLLEELHNLLETILTIDPNKPPEDWTLISIGPLIRFEELPEDVFIRLSETKLVKLFRQGDKIDQQDVEKYTKKGVKGLYIQRLAYLWMVKQIDKIIPSVDEKPEALINVESSGITKEIEVEPFDLGLPVPIDESFVKEVHHKKKKVLDDMRKNKELASLLKMLDLDRNPKSFFRTRINLVCTISCALAKELTWSSDAMFEKFIYAAHMHDLPLIAYPHLTRLLYEWQLDAMPSLTDEERKIFLDHPKEAARLISLDTRAPPEAEMMVRQHHERPNGKGFPDKLQSARIMPTAALIQVAIDFSQHIIENPNWTFESYLEKAAPNFKGGPFTKIFRALEAVCKKKF